MSLLGSDGGAAAKLSFLFGGDPRLELRDANYVNRASFKLDEDGRPALEFLDDEFDLRAVVGCTTTVIERTGAETKHPESTITLFKNNRLVWQAP